MRYEDFIIVGENIHCTRIVKRGGIKMTTLEDGTEVVAFTYQGEERALRVPDSWETTSPDYAKGKCKHVALAIWQTLNGQGDDQQAGQDYLCYVAERQIDNGAKFLDVNVDEYSSDGKLNGEIMDFISRFLSERYETPLSIDSSSPETLAIGLENCRQDIGTPMVNSVSLERESSIDVVKQFGAETIVSAAGRHDLPKDTEGRMVNFREIMALLEKAGIARGKLHLDPLVLGVGTGDHLQGKYFLEATTRANEEFAGVHLNGGLSNISFGLPNRKLLNRVFIDLCTQAGTDGGIIDPAVIPMSSIADLDRDAEDYQLAKAALTGEDEYCMNYVMAMKK